MRSDSMVSFGSFVLKVLELDEVDTEPDCDVTDDDDDDEDDDDREEHKSML